MSERRYTWSFVELCDRLNVVIQKIGYAPNDEMATAFAQERDDIIHDLNLFLKEGVTVTGELINAICCLQFINTKIWQNEEEQRGEKQSEEPIDWEKKYKTLLQSHHWNANRAMLKKYVQQSIGGRVDHKLNYLSEGFDFKIK